MSFNRRHFCQLSLAASLTACGKPTPPPTSTAPPAVTAVYPGKEWEARPPATLGLSAAKLAALANKMSGDQGEDHGDGLVIRHGYVAQTWGTPDRAADLASAAKPVLVHLLLMAIQQGRIPSLDQKVAELEPALAQLNAALRHKDADLTWRHFITQTSCYGVSERPGSAFDYNDFQTALFYRLLFEKALGASINDAGPKVLGPLLATPLGFCRHWRVRPAHEAVSDGRLSIAPCDLARLGYLYLKKGRWQDQQLLPAATVDWALHTPLPASIPRTAGVLAEMLPGAPTYGGGMNQEEHLNCYSQMWWLNRPTPAGPLLWPAAPPDAFAAAGYGGVHALVVMPSLDLIICWTRRPVHMAPMYQEGRVGMNDVLAELLACVE